MIELSPNLVELVYLLQILIQYKPMHIRILYVHVTPCLSASQILSVSMSKLVKLIPDTLRFESFRFAQITDLATITFVSELLSTASNKRLWKEKVVVEE